MMNTDNMLNKQETEEIIKKACENDCMDFSNTDFKKIRMHYQITRESFAKELNISPSTVISIENNRRTVSKKTNDKLQNYIREHECEKTISEQINELDLLILKKIILTQIKISPIIPNTDMIINSLISSFISLSQKGLEHNSKDRIDYWESLSQQLKIFTEQQNTDNNISNNFNIENPKMVNQKNTLKKEKKQLKATQDIPENIQFSLFDYDTTS